jgi:uncharacterized protein YndB with AHSA1/START domain
MSDVTVEQLIQATPAEVWASWDDFANIDVFNPLISKSFLIGAAPTGQGAMRQCNFADGKNHIRERIVAYEPGKRMAVEIFEGTMPVHHALIDISLSPRGDGQTKVTMTLSFRPKFGLLGRMMAPLMRVQFRKTLRQLLQGNADYLEGQPA